MNLEDINNLLELLVHLLEICFFIIPFFKKNMFRIILKNIYTYYHFKFNFKKEYLTLFQIPFSYINFLRYSRNIGQLYC